MSWARLRDPACQMVTTMRTTDVQRHEVSGVSVETALNIDNLGRMHFTARAKVGSHEFGGAGTSRQEATIRLLFSILKNPQVLAALL